MRNSLRTLLAVAVGSVGLLAASPVQAAETATISITVTVQFLSVSVVDGAIALGTKGTGSNTVTTADVQDVTNDGNVAETYTLQLTTTDVYTAGTTETGVGANTYVLQALFQADGGTAAVSGDFGADATNSDDVVLSASAQTASATTYAWTGSTDNGAAVPATTVLDLYFKYSAPTSVTTGAQEDLVVTITATAA